MAAALFHTLHLLFDPRLGFWSSQIHAVVISLLVLAWCFPFLGAMFRGLKKSEPEIEWVQLWRCPECSTYNRRTFTVCTHCEYHMKVGGLVRWVPLWLSQFVKNNARRLLRLYRLLGWTIYYALTVLAFWKLHLYTFHLNSIQELMASGVMFFLLVSLMFFRMAFRPRLKSPLSALMDTIAGLVMTSVMLFGLFLWSEAAAQRQLSQWLRDGYAVSLGRLHFLENISSGIGGPISPLPAAKPLLQKAGRRAP